jgi:hypothetical protein
MVNSGLTEGAMFGHDAELSNGAFTAGCETMRCKGLCHHRDSGLQGTLSFAGCHRRGQMKPVFVPYVFGELFGLTV